MKNLLMLALATLVSAPAVAAPDQDFSTADNIDYVITVTDQTYNSDTAFEKCAKQICAISAKHGNGTCEALRIVGAITTNLTTFDAEKVSKLKCVDAVEESIVVDPLPGVGLSN